MALIKALLEKPARLTAASKYTAMNGFIYLVVGILLIVWPSVTQTVFLEPAFVGHEQGLIRVIGLTVLALRVRRTVGRSTNRGRFRYRSIDIRSCCARTPGNGRRISETAFDIRGS